MERSSKRISTIAVLDFVLLLVLVLAEWNVFHVGTFGLTFDLPQGTVFEVEAGQPAALAGIKQNDRVDFSAIQSADQRRILLQPHAGESLRLVIYHNGRPRNVSLTAVKAASALRTTIDVIGFPILVRRGLRDRAVRQARERRRVFRRRKRGATKIEHDLTLATSLSRPLRRK